MNDVCKMVGAGGELEEEGDRNLLSQQPAVSYRSVNITAALTLCPCTRTRISWGKQKIFFLQMKLMEDWPMRFIKEAISN